MNHESDWIGQHGRQLLELIVSGSGLPAYRALQMLATMAIGYPCSSPPRWCISCKHGTDGGCDRICKPSGEPDDDWWDKISDWNGLHQWRGPDAAPEYGILCDCPGYQEAA